MKDVNGVLIKPGQRVKWLVNTTDIKAHDNFVAEVKYSKTRGLWTDSPLEGDAYRPITDKNCVGLEVL